MRFQAQTGCNLLWLSANLQLSDDARTKILQMDKLAPSFEALRRFSLRHNAVVTVQV
jgi:hypothetical protein